MTITKREFEALAVDTVRQAQRSIEVALRSIGNTNGAIELDNAMALLTRAKEFIQAGQEPTVPAVTVAPPAPRT